jgi:hypothetical protein
MSEITFMRDAIRSAVEDLETGFKFAKEYEKYNNKSDYYGIKQQMMRAHRTLMEALEVE